MTKESATDWQQRLDRSGTVVIRSRRKSAAWTLVGCLALILLGIGLAATRSLIGIVVGCLPAAVGLFATPRAVRTLRAGKPHLVVTADHLEYAGQSVRWAEVREVVRHIMSVRGGYGAYVWILHGERARLRLPDSLQADLAELGGWLSSVHARHREI